MRARMHVIGESVVFFNDTATTEIYTLSLHDASSDLSERPWSGPRARAAPGSPSPATLGSARDLKGPCAAPKSVPPLRPRPREAETGTEVPIKQHLPTKEPAPRRWLSPPRSLPHPRGNPSKGNTRARARACPPPHGTPWGATRHPSPQRGTGTPPLPTRPPAPQTHQRSSGHLRRPTGTGNNTATRPRAPEGRPGMLQGHRQRPGERAHAPGKARGAAATRPAPPWGGAAFETQPRGTGDRKSVV